MLSSMYTKLVFMQVLRSCRLWFRNTTMHTKPSHWFWQVLDSYCLLSELQLNAPTLYRVLQGCVSVKRLEWVMKKGERKGMVARSYRPSNSAILGDCAALLLRHRNHNLNAVQRIISIILYGGHAAKQVLLCNCLQNTFVVYRLLLRQVC